MTIAIGVQCRDGIVLLADRQITKEGGLKYYEEKVRQVGGGTEDRSGMFHLDFAYAGYPDAAKFVLGEIEERVANGEPKKVTIPTLKRCVQTVLEETRKTHKRDMNIELLVAISVTNQGFKLLRTRGKLVVEAELECLGAGDSSLVRYMVETFPTGRTGLHHYLPLLIYTMRQAKKYIEGCGGTTDVLYVHQKEGSPRLNLVPGRLYDAVRTIENDGVLLEREMRHFFEVFYDHNKTEQDISKEMAYMSGVLLKLGKALNRSEFWSRLSRQFLESQNGGGDHVAQSVYE